MPQLDRFLTALTEYKAEALILEQDAPPAFRFLSGTKPVSQHTLDLKNITALVRELSIDSAMDSYEEEGSATFQYELGDSSYTGVLEAESGKLVATIWETTQELAQTDDDSGEEPVKPTSIDVEESQTADGAAIVDGENGLVFGKGESAAAAAGPEAGLTAAQTPLPDFGVNSKAEAIPNDLPAIYRESMDELLHELVEAGASDLHLSSGVSPILRVDGSVQVQHQHQIFDPEHMIRLLFSITPRRNREEFLENRDADFAYSIEGLSRFRVNLFYDRKGPGAVVRAIPNEVMSAEELGLPPVVQELARLHRGLVLVTGPTGCGKSTTLAAILNIVNETREEHIITIEDPVEFVHPNKKCLVNQREVGLHTGSFKAALRAALREDPDVVLVGELRDLETVEIAIETAETGHLVFGTLHTTTAPSTVDRIIDQFTSDRQDQIRTMLSDSLKAVISQTLCKRIGGGRVAAQEILLGNPSVSNLIREGKTFQLDNAMQTGRKLGMRTLNDHLAQLVESRQIDPREAYLNSMDKANLLDALKRQGFEVKI